MTYQYIFQGAHLAKRTGRLEGSGNPQLADCMGLTAVYFFTFEQNFTAAGCNPTADQIEQGCLSGTIWSHQANDLTFVEGEVNRIQCAQIIERLTQRSQL